ncbi:MAG: hypothetical protein U0234_07860 [Sandaracinus sp.]
MKLAPFLAALLLAIAGCGGSAPPPSSTTTSEAPRPVRIASTEEPAPTTGSEAAPRPVRVDPAVPGEVAISGDLADPPPVEPPAP